MIKAVVNTGGKPLVILGLSQRNVDLLQEGKPIKVGGSEIGIEVDIALIFGETEDKIRADLQAQLGPAKVEINRMGKRP